jgi:GNAT superfamily N-acetyltransferase
MDESLGEATEVFVRGFASQRSLTHPYLVSRVEELWKLADAPRRRSTGYRSQEWVAVRDDPVRVDRVVRAGREGNFKVCHILAGGDDRAGVVSEYKKLGYRLRVGEPFMRIAPRVRRAKSPAKISVVGSADEAAELARAAGSRQCSPEQIGDASVARTYVARVEGNIVGWVRSIRVNDCAWVSNLEVLPTHRRRGIGRGLMCALLSGDAQASTRWTVLLASSVGAKLYEAMGFETIGELLLFSART